MQAPSRFHAAQLEKSERLARAMQTWHMPHDGARQDANGDFYACPVCLQVFRLNRRQANILRCCHEPGALALLSRKDEATILGRTAQPVLYTQLCADLERAAGWGGTE